MADARDPRLNGQHCHRCKSGLMTIKDQRPSVFCCDQCAAQFMFKIRGRAAFHPIVGVTEAAKEANEATRGLRWNGRKWA